MIKQAHVLYSKVIRYGKRPRRTVIFLHGIGNSSEAWHGVIEQLKGADVRIVAIDLLGFGRSPRPKYTEYDVVTQAKSVRLTCLLRGIFTKDVVIVGHSMGALVAIEYAKRYPAYVSSLLLCSPPLYAPPKDRYLPTSDDRLRRLYKAALGSPKQFVKLSEVAMKYELINKAFNVTDKNVDSYMSALRAAIINQTSLDDVAVLTLPIQVLQGTLDPVIVQKHIKRLARRHANISVSSIVAGHEVIGRFEKKVVAVLQSELKGKSKGI